MSEFASPVPNPDSEDQCVNCERCTWNPGPDCGRPEHPHCPNCGHCLGRHTSKGHEVDPADVIFPPAGPGEIFHAVVYDPEDPAGTQVELTEANAVTWEESASATGG